MRIACKYGEAETCEVWRKTDGTMYVSAYWGRWRTFANVPASDVLVIR